MCSTCRLYRVYQKKVYCWNNLGQNMEYVVQAFKVLKNLVHAEANARAQKSGFFVAFLTQTRFLCVITN